MDAKTNNKITLGSVGGPSPPLVIIPPLNFNLQLQTKSTAGYNSEVSGEPRKILFSDHFIAESHNVTITRQSDRLNTAMLD
jgi:hypothetical protein